jgi:UDP-2,3-diacylglucosamine pyrophosphatase LpxH
MLVIISDLHFTDGTTSNWIRKKDLFNINPDAFKLLVGKISNIIARRKSIPKVTFIYNGDIFDPLRTNLWFEASEAERPWSIPFEKDKVYQRSNFILEKIIEHNQESLAWLSGTHPDFENAWKVDSEIDRIYIPGNHDRIINQHQPCRKLVHDRLLGQTGNRRFNNFYMDQEYYQTLVMHGHEADPFNCEFDKNGNPKYGAVPIGDPMTTVLFARLGYEAEKLPIPQEAKMRFKDIDNVRPTLATIRYVQDIIQDFNIGKKVDYMIKEIVADFEGLKYFDEWNKKHDRWNIGFDEADKLQFALRAIKLLGTSVPAGLLEKLAGLLKDESHQKLAQRHLERALGKNIRYCVFGHTHEPLHVPLFLDNDLKMEKHYLNTGTFRTTFSQTFNKKEFLGFQRMSFVMIYGAGEYAGNKDIPMYEMWSGLRMHH